jgi:eukaryotic-like serine/threonine-protein kinase
MPNLSQTDTPDFPDIVGRMAGEYRLTRKLGEGGFGAVYEAEHPVLKRRAAVKVLHKAAAANSDAVLRFIAEAQSVNQIRSPHIVDIFSFGKLADGRHFFVMDLLDGEPLDAYLAREGPLDIATTIQLVTPITQALDAAHGAGLVHRDIKPQNIYLAWQSNGDTLPMLLDFGLVKLLDDSPVHTASGTPMGTPLYMSPEQARGEKVDRRADVYALGVLCHELLTGQPPLTGESTVAVLLAHLTKAPPRASEVNPALPPELDAPILRMLAKDPELRPASAGEALAELRQAAERAGVVILSEAPRLSRPARIPSAVSSSVISGHVAIQRAASPSDQSSDREALVRTTSGHGDRRGFGWILLGLIVVLGGGVTFIITRGPSRPQSQTQASLGDRSNESSMMQSRTEGALPSPSAAVVESPKEQSNVELRFVGAPAGAQIWLDGHVLGETPGPILVPYGVSPLKLQVVAAAHDAATLTIVPEASLSINVHLQKRSAGRVAPKSGIPKDLESPF